MGQKGKHTSFNIRYIKLRNQPFLLCSSYSLQFQVLTCSSADAIPTLHPFLKADKGTSEELSLVLMDHDPEQYLPDLLALEREELLSPSGCSILLINRKQRAGDLRDVLDHIRARPNCYSVKSEQQCMMEVFYQKKISTVTQ